MLKCWSLDPDERPSFDDVIKNLPDLFHVYEDMKPTPPPEYDDTLCQFGGAPSFKH